MGGAGDQGREGSVCTEAASKGFLEEEGLAFFFLSKRQFTVHILFTVFYSVLI